MKVRPPFPEQHSPLELFSPMTPQQCHSRRRESDGPAGAVGLRRKEHVLTFDPLEGRRDA
jgi:hypothetical protein